MNENCLERCPVVANTVAVLRETTDPALTNAGEDLLGRLAAGCSSADAGPLTMQATRGDICFRATACTSAGVPAQGPNETYEPVRLVRLPA